MKEDGRGGGGSELKVFSWADYFNGFEIEVKNRLKRPSKEEGGLFISIFFYTHNFPILDIELSNLQI